MAYGANRTTVVTDTFTGSISGNWTNGAGAVRGNCVWAAGDLVQGAGVGTWGSLRYTASAPTAAQYCKVTIGTLSATDANALGARVRTQAPATDEAGYEGWVNSSAASAKYLVYEIASNNSQTTLSSTGTGGAFATGDTVTLEAEGTTLRMGTSESGGADTQRITTTDNTYSSGNAGLAVYPTSVAARATITDFEYGNIAAVVPGVVFATGQIIVSTAAVNTTFPVSGLTFQPKAILFTTTGRSANTNIEGEAQFAFGFATSTSSRRTCAISSDHGNNSNAIAKNVWRNDAVIETMIPAGTIDGLLDLSAIASDGFTVIIDDTFAATTIVNWLAIGGADITDVAIVDFLGKATTGDTDVATGFALNTGADDKCVIGMGVRNTGASGTIGADATIGIAVAAGNTIAQACLGGHSDDLAGTQLTCGYARAGEFVPMLDNDIVVQRTSITSWLADGFRVNWAETNAAAVRFSALVIKGGRWFVGDFVTSTGTTATAEAVPYTPTGLFLGSAGRAASTADTTSAHQMMTLGFSDGAAQNYIVYQDKDAATTSDCFVGCGPDVIYAHANATIAAQALDGYMTLVSIDSTPQFTWQMVDGDPSASFVWYLGGGPGPVSTNDITAAGAMALTTPVVQLKASGKLAGAGACALSTSAALKGTGKLVAAGASALTTSAVLVGVVNQNIVAVGACALTTSAALKAPGKLAGAGALAMTTAAPLKGAGKLVAAGASAMTSSAVLKGVSVARAVGAMQLTSAAVLKAPGKLAGVGASVLTTAAVLTDEIVGLACLLVTGNPAGAGDDELQAMITAQGHTVTTRLDSQTEDHSGKDYIVIAPSVSGASLGTKYKTAAKPILYFAASVIDDHGLFSVVSA